MTPPRSNSGIASGPDPADVTRRRPLTGLRRAFGLWLLDHRPTVAARPVVWTWLAGGEAFRTRWEARPLPTGVERWHGRLVAAGRSAPVRAAQRWRHRRTARSTAAIGLRAADAAPGPPSVNWLGVAIAVDSHLDGHPASAVAWTAGTDPVLTVDLVAVHPTVGHSESATDRRQTERIVAAWGPGAKGIVSVRVPGDPRHHVLNATTDDAGTVAFALHRAGVRRDWTGRVQVVGDPCSAADEVLARVDPDDGFASIRLWRTADLPDAAGITERFPALSATERRSVLDAVLPAAMPEEHRTVAAAWCDAFPEPASVRWFVQQVRMGASTLLPSQLEDLVAGRLEDLPVPLTRVDAALHTLARHGTLSLRGPFVEGTVTDGDEVQRAIDAFATVELFADTVDGLAPGTRWICIPAMARARTDLDDPRYEPPEPVPSVPAGPASRPEPRRWSWIDVNRGLGVGTRRTNCWNSAAAVAAYLTHGSVSSSLPIHPEFPLRPTIPEYLAMMGVEARPVFVRDLAEADEAVRAWGDGRHGLVIASLNRTSTHLFNAYVHDGAVRYVDGHSGQDGRFNFDTRWERIGVAPLGVLGPPGTWPTPLR